MFFLLYKHADDAVFDDFPKISDHFPKISKDFLKLFRRPDKRFRSFSEHSQTFLSHSFTALTSEILFLPGEHENMRKCSKISEDFRSLPKTSPKMFRLYTNEFKYNL